MVNRLHARRRRVVVAAPAQISIFSLFHAAILSYTMPTTPGSLDEEVIITISPEAKPEHEARFLDELASAILAIARHRIEDKTEDSK